MFNELAKFALAVIERRALEAGYRQLADSGADERDSVDDFLERQALGGFGYEDPTPLLDFLSRNPA